MTPASSGQTSRHDELLQENARQQQELLEQLALAENRLAKLEQQLEVVDAELGALSGKREQHELLDTICKSLERLDALGAGDLFWGDRLDASAWEGHLAAVKTQSAAFCAEIEAVETRRADAIRHIHEQDDTVDVINYQLQELRDEEEQRKSEWVIEREESPPPKRRIIMPWTRGTEEDQRFHRSLAGSVLASLLLAILLSLVDVPIPEREQLMQLPERMARLVETPPPPPVQEAPAEPDIPEEMPPEELVVEESAEIVQPVEVAEQQAPKQQVKSKGILAFRDAFADTARRPSANLGAQARIGNSGEAAVGRPTRSMVTTNAPGSSGGINLAAISRDVGGGAAGDQIGGVAVTRVASSIGGDGSADRPRAGGPSAGRTDEEIQIVFDRYKASLYRLYNRELRRDPTLRGQLVIRLTIEPDGSVSMCALHSSNMKAPSLADQIVARVSGFDFGAKENISAMTIIYPIDFLPASS